MDGHDLRSLHVGWLRGQMGIVGQEPSLFDISIKENIRLGNKEATDEEIITACKQANAHDFIKALPMVKFLILKRHIKKYAFTYIQPD